MNGGGAADLRALVRDAVQLDGGRGGSLKHHELGPGIREKKVFSTDLWGRTALARSGDGLDRLTRQLDEPIFELPKQQAVEVRRKLFGQPTVVAALPVTEELLLADGVEMQRSLKAYRRICLAAVFVPAGEQLVAGELTGGRVAGIGVYTALMRNSGASVEDAWFVAQWADSTTGFVTSLIDLVGIATVEPGADAPRVAIVVTSALAYDDSVVESIQQLANLIGLRSTILRLQHDNYDSVRGAVTGRVARHLVFVGETGIGDIGDAFMHATEGNRVYAVTDRSPELALLAVQEQLVRLAGFGPALMKLTARTAQDVLPVMPIQSPRECYHYSGRVYVLDRVTKRWWTRDDAKHANVRFKSYRRVDNRLEWLADHDANGDPYERKHKGDEGKEVPLAGGHSCPNVKAHLFA